MKLADLLTSDHIRVPLRATTLEGALEVLLSAMGEQSGLSSSEEQPFAHDLAGGKIGELVRVNDDVLVAVARSPDAPDLAGALGVSATPIPVPGRDEDDEDAEHQDPGIRVLFLLVTPRKLSTLRHQVIPSLTRATRDPIRTQRILNALTAGEVRSLGELMRLNLDERLLVEDALSPVSFRIYPETPMEEVLDLFVRRGLKAVPVVGENYEVLGMITAGEALKYLLQRRRSGEGESSGAPGGTPAMARDVMSRSVMCISEDQSLLEAANLMVNRDVSQLPVVREGELIGFLTRDAVLQKLKR